MKEIGGYIELDTYELPMLYDDLLKFNCARNCLAYLIKTKKIAKIFLPYFLCDSVFEIVKKYSVDINYYHIDKNFLPEKIDVHDDEYIYIVNYYGQLDNNDKRKLQKKYKNVILDNTQAYFDEPFIDFDNIYSCRKFFGVPDGGLLYSKQIKEYDVLQYDKSYNRMIHILGRYENRADEFYSDFKKNEDEFINSDILKMSILTENLLHGINYDNIKEKRNKNFEYLFNHLAKINLLNLKKITGAYAYPLLIENAEEIRNELIKNKIYIPVLWPNVLNELTDNTIEYNFAKNILPLPCDQRYSIDDMEKMCKILQKIK